MPTLASKKTFFLYTTIALFALFLLPQITFAQVTPQINNVLVPTATPENPGPNEVVRISVKSFSIDINNATISWFVNGQLELQGIGQTNFQFTTGDIGSTSVIDIVAETGGSVKREQIVFNPADVGILWQARTYAHPLYLGKRLPSVESIIAVEAIPNFIDSLGRVFSREELTYTWYVDGKIIERVSGRGKSALTVSQAKPLPTLAIEVLVESPNKLLAKNKKIVIPIVSPTVTLYENNPLLGQLFNRAITGSYALTESETKFVAYPLFMTLLNRNDAHITYSWLLNTDPITPGNDRSSITVRQSGNDSGEAKVSVEVKNTQYIFQSTATDFLIKFGESAFSGFSL